MCARVELSVDFSLFCLFVMLSCHHLFCRSVELPKQELLAWTHTARSSGRRMSSGRGIKFRLQSCFFFSPVANHLVLCFLCCVVTRSGQLMMGQLLVCIVLSPETLCLCVTGLWSTVCARVELSVDFSLFCLIWISLNRNMNYFTDCIMLSSVAGMKNRPKFRKNRPKTDLLFPKKQTKNRPISQKNRP